MHSNLDDKEILHLYFDLRWEVNKIAKHFDLAPSTIRSRLKKSGRKLRPPSYPKYRISKKTLKKLYVVQRLSSRKIAKKLNVPERAVLNHLQLNGMCRGRGGSQKNPDLVFDTLKTGKTARLHISMGERNWYAGLYKKAKTRGFKISLRKIDDHTAAVTRLQTEQELAEEPRWNSDVVEEIRRLYVTEKWSVSHIAEHLDVYRAQIYKIMRGSRIALLKRSRFLTPIRPGFPKTQEVSKQELTSLYLTQRLSVPKIAKELGIDTLDVIRELKRHGVWPGARRPFKIYFPGIEKLKIDEEKVFRTNLELLYRLYREAHWFNIRVLARKVDNKHYRLIRKPFVTEKVVQDLLKSGMVPSHVAKYLLVAPKSIKNFVASFKKGVVGTREASE
jgi:predicted DNA-binding protein YlxM (UPF0122 family)